jgi:hypothetical protein
VSTNISPGNAISPLSLAARTWLGRRRFDTGSNSSSDSPNASPSDSLTDQLTCRALVVSDGGADVPKTTAPSVGYLARTMKYYGNAKASHEATQSNRIARKGTVDSPCSCSLHTTFCTWKSKHRTTYAHLLLRQPESTKKTRNNSTLGILTHQVGTRIPITT